MTAEKAIDLLDNLKGMIEDNQSNDYDQAFQMAIKALENADRYKHISISTGIGEPVRGLLDTRKNIFFCTMMTCEYAGSLGIKIKEVET